MAGYKFSDLIFVEVFSGTAGLTAAVCRLGCHQATGVDAHVTKQVKSRVIRIDLSSDPGQALLWRILKQPKVLAIHLGPPCGTSSRAREIKRRHGINPKPLRRAEHPDGLPGLQPRDMARVNTANALYQLCGEIMAYATSNGIICSLENPAHSHMWDISFVNKGLHPVRHGLHTVLFHHCMFGSKRKKRTKLLVNHSCLSHLNRDCDQSHQHEGWGYTSQGWATSLEVEYPHALCRAWANCLQQAALQHGAIALPLEMRQDDGMNLNLQAKASLGVPVRGKRLKPLMREHSRTMTITGPKDAYLPCPTKFRTPLSFLLHVAVPRRILSFQSRPNNYVPLFFYRGVWPGKKMMICGKLNMAYLGNQWSLSRKPVAFHILVISWMDCTMYCNHSWTRWPPLSVMWWQWSGLLPCGSGPCALQSSKPRGSMVLRIPLHMQRGRLVAKIWFCLRRWWKLRALQTLALQEILLRGSISWDPCHLVGSTPRSRCMRLSCPSKSVRCHLLPGRPHGARSAAQRMTRCAKTSTIQLWKNARRGG